jgi:hypothetical protein
MDLQRDRALFIQFPSRSGLANGNGNAGIEIVVIFCRHGTDIPSSASAYPYS